MRGGRIAELEKIHDWRTMRSDRCLGGEGGLL